MNDWNVIVVGGGISGLAAADELVERGWRVLLLEREERLGGRIRTNRAERLPLEMGPSYVGPTQSRMHALLRRFGLSTNYNQFGEDKLSVNHFDLGIGPPLRTTFQGTHTEVPDIDRAIVALDKLTAQVATNLEEPWELPAELLQYDRMSVQEWSDNVLTEGQYGGFAFVMRKLLAVFVRSILSVEPHELSMLFFLYYCARCGGFRYMVSAVDYGPDSERVREGLDTLVQKLAESLTARGATLKTGVAVDEIADAGDGVVVTAGGEPFRAPRVIIAVPPAAVLAMRFRTPLPEERRQLYEGMRPGSTFKGYVVFDEPWFHDFPGFSWPRLRGLKIQLPRVDTALRTGRGGLRSTLRALGLVVPTGYTGYTNGDAYRVGWTMDGSWRDTGGRVVQPAVMWFVVGQDARDFARLSRDERRERVCADIAELFAGCRFPAAKLRYYEQDWTEAPHSAGPTSVMAPELLSRYGAALRKPFGRIHWAGTETAVRWGGYMEGGVEAGVRAGHEVHHALAAEGRLP